VFQNSLSNETLKQENSYQMADSPIRVKAYGKLINFPAGTTPEEMELTLSENEHVLNPEYKQPSGASGLLGSLPRGVKGTGRLLSAGFDTFTGDLKGVEQTAGSANLASQRETPAEQLKLQQELADINRDQGVMSQIGDTLKTAGRNPMGTGQLVVEQLPNSAVTLAGGYTGFKAGALAGAPFGPVGMTIGGTIGFLGGMFLGNTLIEAGSKGIQKASDEDGFTPQDKDETIRESAIKGAVLTGVDGATLKLGSMVMKRLGSSAVREGAKAEAKVLMDAGVDMSSTATINAALKSSPELMQAARTAGEKAAISSMSRSRKAGIVGTGAALETVGEGVGEYAGEYAATGEGDVVDATIESLSSATMSAAETAYNYNKLKAGNDLSPEGMQNAITSESLRGKQGAAAQQADAVNARTMEESAAEINAAQDIDQVIAAAANASAKPVTSSNDVLRSEDPTLADIEKLTGLKPTEAIDTAIGEIENPIIDQPQEDLLNGNNDRTQGQEATKATETTVLEDTVASVQEQERVSQPAEVGEALTENAPVLKAEELKARGVKTSYDQYLREHPNRKVAASVDLKNVEGTILKGLEKTGKFDKKTRETYATPFREFYKVNAERQGVLPSELYERLPLKFSGKQEGTVLNQEGVPTPAARNKANFGRKEATPDDFTPEGVNNLLNRKNWAVLTAANPLGKAQSDQANLRANEALKKELAEKGFAYEVVKGKYPGDTKEMESYLVYGIDRKAANDLGNKYKQDSVLTPEGLVHKNGRTTPVRTSGKGSKEWYTKVPRTGATFAFDMDWSREAAAEEGALSLTGRHYSAKQRPALEGSRFGQGYPGGERDRIAESNDPRLKSRVDFYVDVGNGITPESGLGSAVHETMLHNIYDGSTNPRKFKHPSGRLGANVFEQQVLDAGYDGYYTLQGKQGRVVVLGDAAKSIPIEGNNEQRENKFLAQSSGKDTGARESDGSLKGLPRQVGQFKAASFRKAQEVAKKYTKAAGIEYNPPTDYVKVNEARAKRIAQAFDEMKHDPQNPEVKAAYAALVKETTDQYQAVVDSGLKVEFIDFDKTGDPYEGSPRAMTEDVRSNNHMWVFSTRDGFGSSEFDPADNPLLAETEFEISGQKALVNDLFRVVHDYFGHVKEGVGFRAAGEENAWMAHMAMFSPLAGRALTTETRGQNSWVNYGPFAEHNKTASGADTKYADQKIGLLPEWASTEGRVDEEYNQSIKLSTAKETLKKYGLKQGQRYSTRQVAAALEARQRAKFGSIVAGDYSKESLSKIASWMAEEVAFEMQNPEDSGAGWYSERFQGALDVMGEKYPELKTDKNARNTFTALLAITSDGQKVGANLKLADGIYGRYKDTGKFTLRGDAAQRNSFQGNLDALQDIVDKMGVEKAHEFLLDEKSLSDLKKLAAEHGKTLNSPYQADFKLPMAALAFGPKLGAFYANLMGSHGYLTMDRWWSRTFNRYRGSLLQSPTKASLTTFRESIGQRNLSDDETIAATVAPRDAYEARGFKTRLAELVGSSEPATDKAKVNWLETAKAKAGARFPELLKEHNIERAANTIYKKAFENLEDMPFSAKDRTFMTEATKAAQRKLAKKGLRPSIADMQAILWYYEKKLYGKMGAKQSGVISYEDAARRLVSGKADGSDIGGGTGAAATGLGNEEVSIGDEDFSESYSQSNFYSALEREITNLKKIANKNGEVSVDQAKAWINSRQKEGKFKQAEVEAVGLLDWLDTLEGKVPVADVEDFVRENGVQVEEVVLEGEGESRVDDEEVYDAAYQDFIENYDGPDDSVYDDAISEVAEEMMSDPNDSRWGSLMGLSDAADIDSWVEDPEENTRTLAKQLKSEYDAQEILGEDKYYEIKDEQAESDWDYSRDTYIERARERLGGEPVGGTEFGQYVLRRGGDGYKELLMTLPNSKANFSAPHFGAAQDNGAENIFAHTRINEREMDLPLNEEQLAEKAAYTAWEAGDRTPEVKQLLSDRDEANRDYRVAFEKWKERLVRDTSISDREYERQLGEISSNPPEELKPFIERIDEIGAKVKELQGLRLALKPKEPSTSGAKEKVLFVEEIQSDWAQKGRDEGFKRTLTKDEIKELENLEREQEAYYRKSVDEASVQDIQRSEEVRTRIKELHNIMDGSGSIPTAPFVTDTKAWTALVVKRLLRYAAENGFDRIAWTTGSQQSERYRLSKFVESVKATRNEDGKYYVHAETEDGRSVIADYYEENKLAGTIGKELAEKIIEQPDGEQVYTGLDLDIGGQGMKEFYDRIVPSVVNDVAKKLGGGKVETVSMGGQAGRVIKGLEGRILITYPNGSYLKNRNTGVMTESQDRADGFESVEEASKFLDRFESQNLDEVGRQMSLRITPAMKDKVMQGLPLFQRDRAGFNPKTFTISLMDGSDLSSVIHEGGHFYLEGLAEMASQPNAPEQIVKDFDTTLKWFGVEKDAWQSMTLNQRRPYHEQWAQSFERYSLEGVSPTEEMQPVFDRFKEWMLDVYKSLKEFLRQNPLAGKLNDEVRGVFDRLLASERAIEETKKARGLLKQSGKNNEVTVDQGLLRVALAETSKVKGIFIYDLQKDSQGVIPGRPTDLNRALARGEYSTEDIKKGWTKTRELLKSRYGPVVTLYRANAPEGERSNETQVVYAGDKAMSSKFAVNGRVLTKFTVPVEDVLALYTTPSDYYEFVVVKPESLAQSGKTQVPPTAQVPKPVFNPNTDIPETLPRKAQRLTQDAFNRFTVIQNWLKEKGVTLSEKADVYQAEERYHSLVANQLEDFREQVRNPLIEKIAKAGFTLSDVSDFLEAQHASEANKAIQDLQKDPTATAYGITDQEAANYLAKADPKLAKLSNELRDITEQSKQMRLKAGLLSQEEVDAWESAYDHYIPVKGDADAKGGTGKGLKVNFKTKRRLGHGKRDEAVIENILLDHERAIMQVEKNRVAKHLAMMAAEMKMPEIVSVGQPVKRKTLRGTTAYEVQVSGVTRSVFNNKQAADMFKQLLPSLDKSVKPTDITVNATKDQRIVAMASPMLAENEINAYIDGHAIRIQINDDLLARAYAKLGVTGFSALVSAGRAFNGYLSKVYTGYNPEFILTNMIRDFTSGLINLTGEEGVKMAAKASGNYVKSFGSLLRYAASNGKKSDRWIDMYRANGGNTGAAYLSDLERLGTEVKTEYAAYQGVLANLKTGDMANAARAAGRKAFNLTLKWIYNLNQAGENAMRLAAFRAMIESGKTANEAAKVAKNITVNFNRKGEYGAEANAAYLFFNASVQGVAALAHAHFKGKHKYQAWGLSSMVTVLGYMASAALMGGDDEGEEYDKVNDYTKSRNLLIKAGDGYAQIPVPYGYGFFWNLGRSMAEAQHKEELGALPWHVAASAIEEFTPFSDTVVGTQDGFQFDQVLLGLAPTVAKIPLQPALNMQLFSGGEMMPDSAFQKFQPDREKLWRATQGTMYDRMAGWLDEAIGADVSPETLKHYTRTLTGGAGAMVDSTVSAAMLKSEGVTLEPSEIPFARKAYSKLTIRDHRSAYYRAREEAQKTAEAFTRAKARNDMTTINKLVEDEAEMIGLDAYASSLSEAISVVRDMQDAIRLSDDLSTAEKRTQIKELELTEQKFYDQYLDVFKIEKAKMKERRKE